MFLTLEKYLSWRGTVTWRQVGYFYIRSTLPLVVTSHKKCLGFWWRFGFFSASLLRQVHLLWSDWLECSAFAQLVNATVIDAFFELNAFLHTAGKDFAVSTLPELELTTFVYVEGTA
jgi:hypothetical protein